MPWNTKPSRRSYWDSLIYVAAAQPKQFCARITSGGGALIEVKLWSEPQLPVGASRAVTWRFVFRTSPKLTLNDSVNWWENVHLFGCSEEDVYQKQPRDNNFGLILLRVALQIIILSLSYSFTHTGWVISLTCLQLYPIVSRPRDRFSDIHIHCQIQNLPCSNISRRDCP